MYFLGSWYLSSQIIELHAEISNVSLKLLCMDKFKNTKLLFGHSAWEKNQLDNEIKNGDWLVHDSLENLFEKNPKTLWKDLIKRFGFDKFKMTGVSGVS